MNSRSDAIPHTTGGGVSRRSFLAGLSAGSLVLMARASGGSVSVAAASAQSADTFDPDLFVSIAPDGVVTITAHRSEMGTGIRTGLPRVVADELSADWDRVRISQAIGDKRLGSQNTDGSNSITHFFERMRIAGATARTMLERAAAQMWKAAPSECKAENHQVVHLAGDRKADFGDLVAVARTLEVPDPAELKLKPRSEWRYIGRDTPIVDMDAILTGKAVYGIDARMDGQLFAVVARPPVVGGRVRSFDDSKARAVPGVREIVEIPGFQGAPLFQPLGGIAVCADSTYAAIAGRDALEIEWEDGENSEYDSEQFRATLEEAVTRSGKVARDTGDAMSVLADADPESVHTADYYVPHLSHAPMEPTCAVADIRTDESGNVVSCVVTAATQNPQAVQQAVASAMDISEGDVIVNVTLLGAAFGRKSKPDYCVEAAVLSRQLKRPVHVTWTREDDLHHDYYHTVSCIRLQAAVDDRGKPKAWLHRSAYPTIGSTFAPGADSPAAWELEMGATDLPFDVPNIRVEGCSAKAHTRIGWMRAVAHIQQNFAVSSFVDELAYRAKREPLEFLLEFLGPDRRIDIKEAGLANRGADPNRHPFDIGRLKAVTRRCAEFADWWNFRRLPKGTGVGVACARSFLGYTAHVIHVEVARSGELTIQDVWTVLDSGIIVSPDRVRAQIEGAAVMASTQTRYGSITFRNGRAQQSNFDSYRMTRMADSPKRIHIEIVDSQATPAGVGETPMASFAPALCNAVYRATGKRIRSLPIADHDLSWA